mmetsp:Transcript_5567/g.13952  ORF Transcript_5567/g.13952 Transcript_5567/m.13952 type:complete len:492 (-) Transcript_5567:38-1513(-)|eukprot:CAMPEP_0197192698 /NCGR_PEP_ID=MMETSP1423-20130617/25524_1 /TAXON_ID=476441 /ORGANISM="Pseudo-nitzschia heimii, Strain UNC1101" /LENGTH=491 /DNA_ID=CAMNT_0042645635 /DNA_START=109 /DNA_END=1584 /DNA_ORIENTATION=-
MKREQATVRNLLTGHRARIKPDTHLDKDNAKSNSKCSPARKKVILLGGGNSIWERNPNIHLRNFVDIFRDHYEYSGHTERYRIVCMVIELLQNDGYSFLKSSSIIRIDAHYPATRKSRHEIFSSRSQPEHTLANTIDKTTNRFTDSASTSISFSEDANIMTDNSDKRVASHSDSHVSWVVASPHDVHKEVTRLFQKTYHNSNAFLDSTDPIFSSMQQQKQQQTIEALHRAITAAIDTSSLVEATRNFPSPPSSPPDSSSPSLSSLLADPNLDQLETHQHQQHSLPPFFLSPPASLSEKGTIVEEPYITTISARTNANNSNTSVVNNESTSDPSSITTTHARKLLEQHLGSTLSPTLSPILSPISLPTASPKLSSNGKESCSHQHFSKTSVVPEDGVLWSKGSRKISLLEDVNDNLVPITSYTLFENAENDAFSASSPTCANSPKSCEATTVGEIIESSMTIGYTQQQIGHLTILRPIVLLPDVQTDNAVAL